MLYVEGRLSVGTLTPSSEKTFLGRGDRAPAQKALIRGFLTLAPRRLS